MQELIISLPTVNLNLLKKQVLEWAHQQSEVLCYLDSNQYQEDQYSGYEALLGVGVERELKLEVATNAFGELKTFAAQEKEWLFGHLNYDLKNTVEVLTSKNADQLAFPELYFFVPTYLFLWLKDGSLKIASKKEHPQEIWSAIQQTNIPLRESVVQAAIQAKYSKEKYLKTVEQVRQHIIDGDVYEMNFCQEFFAEEVALEPLPLFHRMNTIAKAPFTAYYKRKEHHLLCGSPERFMCKQGTTIISQPIKGTIKRGVDANEDEALKAILKNSIKDQAENVMIVDLVRNDLTKTCQTGTIKVKELFGIYGFERVFQMISTVVGEVQPQQHWVDVIREAFPMGSMTGAPKVMSMELIEQYEQSKRGLYSGTVGYVSPEGDFDFNVVIRSLLYNSAKQYLSFQVGGAIVYDSDPLSEYEECLLKAQTMLEALGIAAPTH